MKILMVCLGNICRSPLAQGILEKKTQHLNFEIDSAGTASFHIGKNPDIRSIEIAKKNHIDIKNQKARKFEINDFDKFDIIYAMDMQNYKHLNNLARNKNDLDKVKLILNEIYPNQWQPVPDPYYGKEDGFQNVYNILEEVCEKIISKIG